MADESKPKPAPVPVQAQPGSRLEELHAMYEPLKIAAEEAKERFETLQKAIQVELANSVPDGTTSIALTGAPGLSRINMTWKTPWRFMAKQFSQDYPYLFVKYSKQGGHWEMRVSQ